MTLAEKLLSLRTERELSQEDLAEKLEVSRQSVSKWETGQSIPDLDKIIKLADLFGVSVDELVREGERPRPPEPPQPQVVYVEREKKGLTPVQVLGVICEVMGAGLALVGLIGAPILVLPGAALVVLGLPLLLAKKHPFLIDGWILLAASWFLCPRMGLTPSKLWFGLQWIYAYFVYPGPGRGAILLGGVIVVVQRVLLLVLLYFTVCPLLRTYKEKRAQKDG